MMANIEQREVADHNSNRLEAYDFLMGVKQDQRDRWSLLSATQQVMEFAASEVGEDSLNQMRLINDREVLNALEIHYAEKIWDPIMGFDQPEVVACAPEFSKLKQKIQVVVEQLGSDEALSLRDSVLLEVSSRAVEIIDHALEEYREYDGAPANPVALEKLKGGFEEVFENLETLRYSAVGFNHCSKSAAIDRLNEEAYTAGLTTKEFPTETDFKLKVMDQFFNSRTRVEALTEYKYGLDIARQGALLYADIPLQIKIGRLISSAESKIRELTTGEVEVAHDSAAVVDLHTLHLSASELQSDIDAHSAQRSIAERMRSFFGIVRAPEKMSPREAAIHEAQVQLTQVQKLIEQGSNGESQTVSITATEASEIPVVIFATPPETHRGYEVFEGKANLAYWANEMAAIESESRRPLSGSEFKQVVASIEEHARGAQLHKAEAVDAAGRLATLHGKGGELLFRDPALRTGYIAGRNNQRSFQQNVEPASVPQMADSAPQYAAQKSRMR